MTEEKISSNKLKISFRIDITPVAKQRPRFARIGKTVRTYTPKETLQFEKRIARAAIAKMQGAEPLDGPLHLWAIFNLPRPQRPKDELPIVKPDLDNLIKAVKDGCNKILWTDDARITSMEIKKQYASGEPYIWLEVRQL